MCNITSRRFGVTTAVEYMKGSIHVLIWRYDATVFLVRLRKTTMSCGMVNVQVKVMNVMTSKASAFEATSILYALTCHQTPGT